jgi:hypothetical protein
MNMDIYLLDTTNMSYMDEQKAIDDCCLKHNITREQVVPMYTSNFWKDLTKARNGLGYFEGTRFRPHTFMA